MNSICLSCQLSFDPVRAPGGHCPRCLLLGGGDIGEDAPLSPEETEPMARAAVGEGGRAQRAQRAEAQLTRAEGLVYASKLMLAQTDFETGNGGLALQYLAECQPNLRGWEHRYLSTRINAEQTLRPHRRSNERGLQPRRPADRHRQ